MGTQPPDFVESITGSDNSFASVVEPVEHICQAQVDQLGIPGDGEVFGENGMDYSVEETVVTGGEIEASVNRLVAATDRSDTPRARWGTSISNAKSKRYRKLESDSATCNISIGKYSYPMPISQTLFRYDAKAVRPVVSQDDPKSVSFQRQLHSLSEGVRSHCSYYDDHSAQSRRCQNMVRSLIYSMTGPEGDRMLSLVEGGGDIHSEASAARGLPVLPEEHPITFECSQQCDAKEMRSRRADALGMTSPGDQIRPISYPLSPPSLMGRLTASHPMTGSHPWVNGHTKSPTASNDPDETSPPDFLTLSPKYVPRIRTTNQHSRRVLATRHYQGLAFGDGSGAPKPLDHILVAIQAFGRSAFPMDKDHFKYDSDAVSFRRPASASSIDQNTIIRFARIASSMCSFYPTPSIRGRCRSTVKFLVYSFTGPEERRLLSLVEGCCEEHRDACGRGLPLLPNSRPITYEHSHRCQNTIGSLVRVPTGPDTLCSGGNENGMRGRFGSNLKRKKLYMN